MARTESLDPEILQAIAGQVADQAHRHRRLRANAGQATGPEPAHIGESFPVWSLDLAALSRSGARIRSLGRPTGAWHHQLPHADGVAHYARSRGEAGRPESWHVVELVASPLAEAVEQAVEWLETHHGRDRSIARLVHIPAYLMVVFWLESAKQDRILLVKAPEACARSFKMRELYPATEFLRRLRRLAPVEGAQRRPARAANAARPAAASAAEGKPSLFGSALAGIFLLALAGLAFGAPHLSFSRQYAFVAALALMTLEFVAIGVCLRRGPAGVIIDARNCMSLSKLQACAWTVLVLSALLVAVSFNLAAGGTFVALKIPTELLQALGLSATALAAAPAVLSLKTQQTPSPGALAAAGITPSTQGQTPLNSGALMTNATRQDADWSDMITGDEVGNFATADLGKIQQLLVTLLLLGVYAKLTFDTFVGRAALASLPPLEPSFVWLLAVSQGTYLAYKAAPHTTAA